MASNQASSKNAHPASGRVLIGVVALVLLMSCGGDDTETVEPPAAPSVTETTEPDPSASTLVVAVEVPPCDLLSAADVEAATGLSVVQVRDEPPINCVFDLGGEAGVEVWVTIEDGMGRLAGPANLVEEYTLLTSSGEADFVDGVGERALCCPFRAIAVDAGAGRYIAVSVGGSYTELAEPREALVSLALTALERLE